MWIHQVTLLTDDQEKFWNVLSLPYDFKHGCGTCIHCHYTEGCLIHMGVRCKNGGGHDANETHHYKWNGETRHRVMADEYRK